MLSIHETAIGTPMRSLTNLDAILAIAKEQVAKGTNERALVEARLAPDMFPLPKQVQIACDVAKGGAARLSGMEAPSFPDDETTLAELGARIRETLDFLKTVPAEKLEGAQDKQVTLKVGPNEMSFTGRDYVLGFVLPNVFFHVTTAYGILRSQGVPLGKRDYLGG